MKTALLLITLLTLSSCQHAEKYGAKKTASIFQKLTPK